MMVASLEDHFLVECVDPLTLEPVVLRGRRDGAYDADKGRDAVVTVPDRTLQTV